MEAASDERLLLLDRRMAALKKRAAPDLGESLELQAQLIRVALSSAREPITQSFPLPREQLIARLRDGVPLLHDQPAHVDIHFAADVFSRLVNVLQQREDGDLRGRLDTLAASATGGLLDPQALFVEAFVQHRDHLADIAARAGVDADLLAALAAQSVAPLLRAYAAQLMPLVERADDEAHWSRGYCPVCGAWPLLGELRGVELAQFLRCAGCGSAWRSARLFCPYCQNDDYRSLRSLAIEGEQRFRVGVCERCKGYLKVGNAFDPPSAELLALDDVVTMHLDVAAIERGYQRPGGAGFTIELALPEDEWVEELV